MIARMLALLAVFGVQVARAEAPEPTSARPRILLDDKLRATWKTQAKQKDSAVARAIERCELTRSTPKEYERDSYMGFDWSANLNACLVAWAARGSDDDAKSAIVYFKALLDDLQIVGDGKGGENAVRRDTGYAVRSVPPYAAIAYDWLHDHPLMTPALRAHARERFTQWLTWYKKSGYHNRMAGTNYHAGYALAATLVAVAMGGDGSEFNRELWSHVRDDIWGTDMAKVLAPKGLLDGGDFGEGWQYAPLSVAEYALAYRVAAQHGIAVAGVDTWLQALFVRTVHARSGARDTIAVSGDTEEEKPSIAINALTLLAILIGPAPEAAQRQAAGELARLDLKAKDYPLYEALAQANPAQRAIVGLAKWPTSYFATGVGALFARTTWAPEGVWMWAKCTSNPPEADHNAANAGNLTITRGVDEVLVDPSPYGSMSSLTSNAPTVDSKLLPPNYRPSQAGWGETAHFEWAVQTTTGVVAARCDYADQYKFQERASDISFAIRDLVMIPWGKARGDASVVVIDRAETGGADHPMYLRFRSPIAFELQGDGARAKVGATMFTVKRVTPGSPAPEVRILKKGECWDEKVTTKGGCEFARFPASEYRITIPGPKIEAIHVLDAAPSNDLAIATIADGVTHLHRGNQDAYIAARGGSYTTKAPAAGQPAFHVVLIDGNGAAKLSVTKLGDQCKVAIATDGPARDPGPLVFTVDDKCAATDDPRSGPAAPDLAGSAAGKLIPVGGVPATHNKGRSGMGCCDAGSASSGAFALIVGAALLRRRRRA